MAKLFAEKLQILEKEIDVIKDKNNTVDVNKRLDDLEAKINQIINELTPIITSHANALNALLGKKL